MSDYPVSTGNIEAMLDPLKASIGGGAMVSVSIGGSQTVKMIEDQYVYADLGSSSFETGVPWASYMGGALTVTGPGIFAIDTSGVRVGYSISAYQFRSINIKYLFGSLSFGEKNFDTQETRSGTYSAASIFGANETSIGGASGVFAMRGPSTLKVGCRAYSFFTNGASVSTTFTLSGTLKIYKF